MSPNSPSWPLICSIEFCNQPPSLTHSFLSRLECRYVLALCTCPIWVSLILRAAGVLPGAPRRRAALLQELLRRASHYLARRENAGLIPWYGRRNPAHGHGLLGMSSALRPTTPSEFSPLSTHSHHPFRFKYRATCGPRTSWSPTVSCPRRVYGHIWLAALSPACVLCVAHLISRTHASQLTI